MTTAKHSSSTNGLPQMILSAAALITIPNQIINKLFENPKFRNAVEQAHIAKSHHKIFLV
jgi:hypothetical protein